MCTYTYTNAQIQTLFQWNSSAPNKKLRFHTQLHLFLVYIIDLLLSTVRMDFRKSFRNSNKQSFPSFLYIYMQHRYPYIKRRNTRMHFNGQFEFYVCTEKQYKKKKKKKNWIYSRYVYRRCIHTFWKVVFSLRWIFEEVGNSFVVAIILLKDIVCILW